MSVLFLQGVNDNGLGRLSVGKTGRTSLVLDGTCNVSGKIPFQGADIHKVAVFGDSAEQNLPRLQKPPSLIFNEISDPDSHAGALQRARQYCLDAGVPVINAPEMIQQTTRDQVAELLHGIPGVCMPRTIRFQAEAPEEVFDIAKSANMELPAIMRIAGDHGGISMVRLADHRDIDQLNVFPFGDTVFYLTEFVDYCDQNGIYHKQRIAMVGGKPIARHAVFDRNWNVHGSSHETEGAVPGYQSIVDRTLTLGDKLIPKAESALAEISDRLQLDYFGIDCYIDPDGEMLIFEANANMNIMFDRIRSLSSRIDVIRDEICTMLTSRSGERVSWKRGAQN